MLNDLNFKQLPYRPGVGIILVNEENKVFVGKRFDFPAWQMPQGGIDAGETPLEAALRELEEEVGIGTHFIEIKAESTLWYTYDFSQEARNLFWKERYRGQRQKWFLFRFMGQDSDISLETTHPEFCDWKWVFPNDLVSLAVSFKRDLYQAVVKELLGNLTDLQPPPL